MSGRAGNEGPSHPSDEDLSLGTPAGNKGPRKAGPVVPWLPSQLLPAFILRLPGHAVFCVDGEILGGETMMGRIAEISMMMAIVCKPRVYDPVGPSNLMISCGPK